MLASMKLLQRSVIRSAIGCVFALALSGGAFSQTLSCPVNSNTTLAPQNGFSALNISGPTCQIGSLATLNTANQVTLNIPSNMELDNEYQATSSGFTFNNGTITNDGKIVNGGSIIPSPVTGSDSAGIGAVVNFGTLINNGFIGAGVIFGVGTVTNAGVLDNFGTLAGATLNNAAGTLTNAGDIQEAPGLNGSGVYSEPPGATITNSHGATFNNAGTMELYSYGIGEGGGAFNNLGTFNNYSKFTNSGTLSNNSGGTLTNELTGTITVAPYFVAWSDPAQTMGSYTLGGTFIDQAGSAVINNGSIQNNNILTISGVFTNSGTLTNTTTSSCSNCTDSVGLLTITAGGVLNNLAGSSFVQTAGQTIVDGTINSIPAIQLQGGFLQGTGTINGSVNNIAGAVSPGDPPAAILYSYNTPSLPNPGTLTINGNYTQSAAAFLDIGLGGTGAGDFSVLDLSGLATLDGVVEFFAADGFTPVAGDDFTFLNFGSLSGSFAGFDPIDWSCPIGDTCELVYGANSVSLDILGPSGNGGSGGTGGTGNTPEPSSFLLLSAALLALVGCSRAKRISANA